jgi:hypothetical protein
MRRVALLLLGTLALWAVVALYCRLTRRDAAGEAVLAYSAVAAGLCLVPTALTLLWSGRALGGPPEQQLVAVLGGTGVRLFAVLLAALALHSWVPYFQEHPGFWVWVLVFYLYTLTLEMVLLLAGRPGPAA